jgi:hypothetical protein
MAQYDQSKVTRAIADQLIGGHHWRLAAVARKVHVMKFGLAVQNSASHLRRVQSTEF